MSHIDGIVLDSSGNILNGLTAKLWLGSAFPIVPPQKDTALPSAGFLVQTVTTGPQHGSDGAYRFMNVPYGDYWVSVEFSSSVSWESAHVGLISGDFRPGDITGENVFADGADIGGLMAAASVSSPSIIGTTVSATNLQIGGNKVARFVDIAQSFVVNAASTTTDTVTTVTATAVPTTGVIAVRINVLARATVINASDPPYVSVTDHGRPANWGSRTYPASVGVFNGTQSFIKTGGSNMRQFEIEVNVGTGGGTVVYYVIVDGYWTTAP